MKIAYILDWPKNPFTGVPNKILDQIKVWSNYNCKTSLIVIVPKKYQRDWDITANKVFTYKTFGGRIMARFYCSIYLIFIMRPQVIYRRLGIFTFSEIMTIILRPTVIELNTNNHHYYKLKSKPLLLLYLIQNFIISIFVKSACAVTPEIAGMQLKRLRNKTGFFTNSINLGNFPIKQKNKINSRTSFVFAVSDNFVWNGLDKLQSVAVKFPDSDFHIIGIDNRNSQNVFYHKAIYGDELIKFLDQFDFGISTLDLGKIHLTEAAPLKSRLYFSCGLPVIGCYVDPVFSTKSDVYFQLKFSNQTDQILNLDEFKDFIAKTENKIVSKNSLISIDSEKVEKERIEFIEQKLKINLKF